MQNPYRTGERLFLRACITKQGPDLLAALVFVGKWFGFPIVVSSLLSEMTENMGLILVVVLLFFWALFGATVIAWNSRLLQFLLVPFFFQPTEYQKKEMRKRLTELEKGWTK